MKVSSLLVSALFFCFFKTSNAQFLGKLQFDDVYLQFGVNNLGINHVPYNRFAEIFPDNPHLQQSFFTSSLRGQERRIDGADLGFGVGFKVKDKENLKVYFGLNIFNGNFINASAYTYRSTFNEPEANPNLPGVLFYTEEIDFIKVSSEQAQVGVNLGLLNSYPLTNFFSVDYGVGFNLGFTAYSETSVVRSQYEGIAYYEHPELGIQRIFVDHNTLFVGNKQFEREDFTNQVRVVSSVTNLSVGFTFSPLKNDLISIFYRFNPMIVHNFSGNLGYSMNTGFGNLFGLKVKVAKG